MMKRDRLQGFTLVEVLVATAMVGLVLALAMKGFMEMKKLTDLTTARTFVRDESSRAVRTIETLLRRCHIIYFNGAPLGIQVNEAQAKAGLPVRSALPQLLSRLGFEPTANANLVPKVASPTVGNFTSRTIDQLATFPSYPLGRFRFAVDVDAVNAAGTLDPGNVFLPITDRLRTADTQAGAADIDRFFPSPLAYFAEAQFDNSSQVAQNTAYVPISWTFYVLYLAPMDLKRDINDPQIPVTTGVNAQRDMGVTNGVAWPRSTVPYQLRLLTVPGVPVVRNLVAGQPFGRRTNAERANPTLTGPINPLDPDNSKLLDYPYDISYDNVNYDPWPIQMTLGAENNLRLTTPGATSLRLVDGRPSGERVNDGIGANNPHPNFRNIGNDPPTNAVLAVDPNLPTRCTDKVIANYVDPDNVHGTSVRLYDHNGLDGVGGKAHNIGGRRFYNAYENSTAASLPNRGYLYRDLADPPRRVLISVSTRFRPTRQLPYQFNTESVEVELEALLNYQSLNRTAL